MIDRTTHLQVSGRIADRQADARARRLAAEAAPAADRMHWVTNGVQAVKGPGLSLVARLRNVRVRVATPIAAAGSEA